MKIILRDNIAVGNGELIDGLMWIHEGFLEAEDCDEEQCVLQSSAARLITLTRLFCFFFTGFFVSNAFWIYNYLSN
mgnify:CR=1 FL=1